MSCVKIKILTISGCVEKYGGAAGRERGRRMFVGRGRRKVAIFATC